MEWFGRSRPGPRGVILGLLFVIPVVLTGCATIEGVGKDLENLGTSIQDTVDAGRPVASPRDRASRSVTPPAPRETAEETRPGTETGDQPPLRADSESGHSTDRILQLANPNTASLDELQSIPAVDENLAHRIRWYSQEVQPFETRQDLQLIPGIDQSTYEQIAPYFDPGPYGNGT